jgi:hypothetical protein
MRFVIPAAALALLAVQAQAQTTTTPATTTPPAATAPAPATTMAPAPSTTTPAMPAKKTATHRMTLQQQFDNVNTTHDGHVSKDQAVAGKWSYVSRNFDAMDKDHKGYVTMDDIHVYAKAHHAMKKPPATPAPAPATSG